MEKKLLELAVEIVEAQAAMSKMTANDIEQALVRVYNALHKMRLAEEQGRSILSGEPVAQAPAASAGADPAFFHQGRQSHLYGM